MTSKETYAQTSRQQRASAGEQVQGRLHLWTERLGVECPVFLERASIWQVTGEAGKQGHSLVGVVREETSATIFHTRRLSEEDIVHELLHVAHPEWLEEAVVAETARLLAKHRRRRESGRRSAALLPS